MPQLDASGEFRQAQTKLTNSDLIFNNKQIYFGKCFNYTLYENEARGRTEICRRHVARDQGKSRHKNARPAQATGRC